MAWCSKCGKRVAPTAAGAHARLCDKCYAKSIRGSASAAAASPSADPNVISILNPIRMEKQLNPTSCWVSAAHFVMACDGGMRVPSMHELIAIHQQPKKKEDSVNLMEGAGDPSTVIKEYSCTTTSHRMNGGPCDEPTFMRIHQSLSWGVPVVAMLRAPRPNQWAAHAVCIVSLDGRRRLVGYKDPGRDDDKIVEQSYGKGGNNDFFELFHYSDFRFGRSGSMAVNFYCQSLLFTATPRMAGVAGLLDERLPRGLGEIVMDYAASPSTGSVVFDV